MNSKPYWIVDEYMLDISERKDEILSFLKSNCEYTIAPFKRFSDIDIPQQYQYGDSKCGISYGSIQFVTRCMKQPNLIVYPMSYYDHDYFHHIEYTSHFEPLDFLNNDGFYVSFIWLYKRFDYYQSILGKDIFVRPNSPKKLFTGTVARELSDLDLMFKTSAVSYNTMVFISSAKRLEKEIRYFIVDGKVVAHSQYHKDHEICISEDDDLECRKLAEKVASDAEPFRNTFVCDVGLCNGFAKVVELNCINTSGWYLADVNAIMTSLNEKIIQEFEEYE